VRYHIDRIAVPGAPRPWGGTCTAAGRSGSRREEPPSEIKFPDTLVEILEEAASDAGSIPAASTKPNPVEARARTRTIQAAMGSSKYSALVVRAGHGDKVLHLVRQGSEAALCGVPSAHLGPDSHETVNVCDDCIQWLPKRMAVSDKFRTIPPK